MSLLGCIPRACQSEKQENEEKPAPKLDDDAEQMRNQGDYFTSSPPRCAVAQTTLE